MKKILIVEDDTFISRLYFAKLQSIGHDVKIAETGKDGLREIQDWRPDLILLDLILPIIDGFELLKRIKADNNLKNIPVIILSNLDQRQSIEQCLKLGADDYMIKANFTPSDVVKKVEKCLQEKNSTIY